MIRWARAVLGTASAIAVLAPAPTAGQASDPTVSTDRTGTAEGEVMLVTGAGWREGATLIVELCGQGGLRGSVDCDVPHQTTAGVGSSGQFSTALLVGRPPTPCPCVVKVTDQTSNLSATAPMAVQGIPTVPITQESIDVPERRIEVSELTISGGSWTEWFGVAAERTIHVTLVNTGAVRIDRPEIDIAWGRGGQPTGVVEAPVLEPMEPGQTQSFTADLAGDGFAFGRRTAQVEVQGLGEVVTSEASTTTYPWALLAAALVAVQLLLLRLRNRLRRRVAPAGPAGDGGIGEPVTAEETLDLRAVAGPPVPTEEVIDLTDGREVKTNGAKPGGGPPGTAPNGQLATDVDEPEATVATVATLDAGDAVDADDRDGTHDAGDPDPPAPELAVSPAVLAALGADLAAAQARIAELERDALACLDEVDATVEQAQAAAAALMRDADQVAAGARQQIAMALEEVRSELAGLRRRQQEILDRQEQVRSAKQMLPVRDEAPDELDRRLAAAVTRALRSP